jgi:predicted ATP-grasp superfamily ATP-dependent carboligase
MKRPVLIVGVEPRITIPIARSLHGHGVPVGVASLSTAEPAPRSRAVSDFVRLPSPDPETHDQSCTFLEFLTRLISECRYDMLIPATDAALALVSEHAARLRELLHVACPPPHVVERVLNKSLTLDFARRAGIRAPSTYRVSNVSELELLSNQLRFPVVAKPYHKSSETDFKVRHFQTYGLLHQALADDDQLGSRILLQEFAEGDGVGIEVLMHHGEPVAIFQHRRLKEVPASGGAAAVAIAEPPERMLVDQALALLRVLEWEGVAMVEFRYDRTQRQSSLMEVNGRYWGTLALPIQSGVEFPWYEWQIAHGEKPAVPLNYSVGARWRWSAGYIRRWHGLAKSSARKALKHPAGLKELVPSFADVSTRDALWDSADPMPAVAELLRAVRDLVVSDIKGTLRALRPVRLRGNDTATRTPLARVKEARMGRFVLALRGASEILLGRKTAGRYLTVFPDDIFLVSYPRSGNTWARFLIGNLVHQDEKVTFTNVESRIPEIYLFPDRVLRRLPHPRILKSHECFDPRYKRVIYIVRDPRDVAISYYHYAIKLRWIDQGYPIEEFVPRFVAAEFDIRAKWAASWSDHVMSWVSMRNESDGFLLLRYEDMIQNTEHELSRVACFLNFKPTTERLTRAVQLSSADHMRELEKKGAHEWQLTKKTRQDEPFVRTAGSGDWRGSLSPSAVAEIEDAWGPTMQAFGYTLSKDAPVTTV